MRRLLLLALATALALEGCDVGVKRGDLAEAPPKGWELLGQKPGSQVKEFDDAIALDRWCEANIGRPASLYDPRARYGGECFAPRVNTLALLTDQAARDPESQAARRTHGYAHTWGLVHTSGDRDWVYPDRTPALPISPAQAAMKLSMEQAEQRRLAQIPRGLMASSAREGSGQ